MKPNVTAPLLCACLFGQILLGCKDARQRQPAEGSVTAKVKDSEVRKTIEEISTLLSKASIANDYETQLKYFTEDAVIEPPLGPAVKGKMEIRKGFGQNIKDSIIVHSHNTTIEELWVCGDKVYDRGKWGLSRTTRGSAIPAAFYGSYFTIWKIQPDGTCLIDYLIYNLDFNPFEGH
jgi:ketosteroid isomerase-like protein